MKSFKSQKRERGLVYQFRRNPFLVVFSLLFGLGSILLFIQTEQCNLRKLAYIITAVVLIKWIKKEKPN